MERTKWPKLIYKENYTKIVPPYTKIDTISEGYIIKMFGEEVKKEVKKNKAVSDLFFKDVIEEVYKRYNISKSLKCYMFTGHEFGKRLNSFKFDKINFEHMEKGSEESKYETTDTNNSTLIEKFRTDGIVDKKAYKIVSVRIFDEYFFFVFTNNLKKFEEEFFKIKIIQKNGYEERIRGKQVWNNRC